MRNIYTALQAFLLVISMLVISSCLPVSPLNPSNPKRYCLWNLTSAEIAVRTDKDSDPKRISPDNYLIFEVDARVVTVSCPHGTKRTYNLPEYIIGGLAIRRGKPCMDIGITEKWRIHELKEKTYDPKTKESTFEVRNLVADASH